MIPSSGLLSPELYAGFPGAGEIRALARRGWMVTVFREHRRLDAVAAVCPLMPSWTDVILLRRGGHAVAYRTPIDATTALDADTVVWHHVGNVHDHVIRSLIDVDQFTVLLVPFPIPPDTFDRGPYPMPPECRPPHPAHRHLVARMSE